MGLGELRLVLYLWSMENNSSYWTVSYGCLPIQPYQPFPDFTPPWYPVPDNPWEPTFPPLDPFPPPTVYPTTTTLTWPPRTPEQRISELELRCAVLERRLADLEVPKETKPHEPAQLPCTCDELPPNALHWEGCPAGRDSRGHKDGLEFLRVWISGHFGKLGLDSPTLHKIVQMIDSIGPKVRKNNP